MHAHDFEQYVILRERPLTEASLDGTWERASRILGKRAVQLGTRQVWGTRPGGMCGSQYYGLDPPWRMVQLYMAACKPAHGWCLKQKAGLPQSQTPLVHEEGQSWAWGSEELEYSMRRVA